MSPGDGGSFPRHGAAPGLLRKLDQTETAEWWGKFAAYGVILLGAVSRLVQYLHYRPLWLDESQVAVSILERRPLELLSPLADAQVAPPGYLLAGKAAIGVLGISEYAVRLPSILGGVAVLILIWLLARRVTTPLAALVALGFAAICGHLIYYSGECKPYSSDAAFALLLTWLAVKYPGRPRLFGGVAALCIWLSFPAVFVLAGIASCHTFSLIRESIVRRAALRSRLIAFAWSHLPWLLSFAVLYCVNILPVRAHSSTMVYMREYWDYAGAFMPVFPTTMAELMWFKLRFLMFFDMPGGFAYPRLAACVWLLGVVALYRRNRMAAALLLLPVVMAAGASALRAYPFHGRMTLFLVPALFLPLGEGGAFLLARARLLGTLLGIGVLGLLAVHPAYHAMANTLVPKSHHQLDLALAYIAQHARPGDTVYLRYEDARAYAFCRQRYPLTGLTIVSEKGRFATQEEQARFVETRIAEVRPGSRLWLPVAYDALEHVDAFRNAFSAHAEPRDEAHFSGASAFGYEIRGRR